MFTNRVTKGPTKWWDPWTGCRKISPGCQNCFLKHHDPCQADPFQGIIFDQPTPPRADFGDVIIVCLWSDFFIEDADDYRSKAWEEIKQHPENIFLIITKRVERIESCLPKDWGDGYDNVVLALTVETQKLVDYRIPLFLQIPCKHKWLSCSPLIEPLNVEKYLSVGNIEFIETAGETGCSDKIRPTYYEWVEDLSEQCKRANVRFTFMKIGGKFIKDEQVLSEYAYAYHSPEADACNLDNAVPIKFVLNGEVFIME